MQFSVVHAVTLLPLVGSSAAKTITVTAAPAIPSDEPQFKTTHLFTSAILNSTNVYRAQHNASAVSWNDTLADFASDYLSSSSSSSSSSSASSDADSSSGDGGCRQFAHSGGPYGENLAMGYPNATASVAAWGDERERYDFGEQGFGEATGHFTQLVWRNTTAVGCGRRLCGEKGWFLVCEYWPRGNVVGEFDDEVGRRVEGAAAAGGRRPGVVRVMGFVAGVTVCVVGW
ncbi:hypothetical protein JDV02_003802 [Purpureocillium takamizusanense]|uniref:SCP domain-containing protein n=1 Tax=Purpureocillium takamizusanense TaxID=2060973 RepID=A0A9Q8QEJ1_9HYPO|nr:uncharacterized protein JDV02_003802 [Purpureocillium takamizusanense]UNI17461.1 hypothetical protein JDV02_003802 [Purpureocillium takamizusanense]